MNAPRHLYGIKNQEPLPPEEAVREGEKNQYRPPALAPNVPVHIRLILRSAAAFVPNANPVLVKLYEDKHGETFLHAERDALLGYKIIKELSPDMPREDVSKFVVACILHDIAKLAVPPEVLYKKAKLTDEERTIYIEPHAQNGAAYVREMPIAKFDEIIARMNHAHNLGLPKLNPNNPQHAEDIARIVEEHHEKLNGSGYPYGKRGEEISWAGRVLGLVDHYDGMMGRNYQDVKLTPAEVIAEIRANDQGKFDPKIFAALCEHVAHLPTDKPNKVVFLGADGAYTAANPASVWRHHLTNDYLVPLPPVRTPDGCPAPNVQGAVLCNMPATTATRQPTRPADPRAVLGKAFAHNITPR